jgi:transposase-like protein
LVEETMQPGMSVSFVARRAGIAPSQLFAWKRRMLEGGHKAIHADEDVVGTSEIRELEKRVCDLERWPPTLSQSRPQAICMSRTALPLTSAGRFSPSSPAGMSLSSCLALRI